jgi:hypothetical protein
LRNKSPRRAEIVESSPRRMDFLGDGIGFKVPIDPFARQVPLKAGMSYGSFDRIEQ